MLPPILFYFKRLISMYTFTLWRPPETIERISLPSPFYSSTITFFNKTDISRTLMFLTMHMENTA